MRWQRSYTGLKTVLVAVCGVATEHLTMVAGGRGSVTEMGCGVKWKKRGAYRWREPMIVGDGCVLHSDCGLTRVTCGRSTVKNMGHRVKETQGVAHNCKEKMNNA